MVARQAQSTTGDHVKMPFEEKRYTTYKEFNDILNRFVNEAMLDGIWVSVAAEDITEVRLGRTFCKVMGMALETARVNCIETTSPKIRFIKIQTRAVQNKIFVKILYSCENQELREFDKSIVKMKDIIEAIGGYISLRLNKDVGVIKIAIPA